MKEYLSLASKKSRLASLQHIIKELKSEIEYMEKESLQFVQPNYNCCHICGDFLREDIPGRQTMKISDKIVICKNCYFTSGKAKLLIRQELKKEAENNATKNISS